MNTNMKKTQQGLTLVELMVTLAVAIILVAVGMPLFSGVAANNRAATQANMFLTAFKLARSEAIKRAAEVSVCALDVSASPPDCGTNSAWSDGLLVFSDSGTVGTVDGGDELIRAFENATSGATASTTGAVVRFLAQGQVDQTNLTANAACSSSGTCIELGMSGASSTQVRCVYVMQSGQVRLDRGACN